MKQLSTKPLYRTYYVNNNVIYNIANGTSPVIDSHAIIYNENSSFPYIAFNGYDKEEAYYFDSLIVDGDKLNNGAFIKTCHECSPESELSPYNYFKFLCKEQIMSVIANYPERLYSYYYDQNNNVNRMKDFGVPLYMIKQTVNTVVNGRPIRISDGRNITNLDDNDLIDLTEETYSIMRENAILKKATKAANNAIANCNKIVDTITLKDI